MANQKTVGFTAWGYGRASHKDNTEGDSLPGQRSRVERYWEHNLSERYAWGGWYQDGKTSAYRIPFAKRDAGGTLLRVMQRGDVLLIDKVDRLWRSTKDFVRLLELLTNRGIRFIFVDQAYLDPETPHGKLFLTMMVAVAEWESHYKSQRTIEGLVRARAAGVSLHGTWKWQIGIALKPIRHPTNPGKQVLCPIWWPECRAVMGRVVHLRDHDKMDWVPIAHLVDEELNGFARGDNGGKYTSANGINRTVRKAAGSSVRCKSNRRIPRPFRAPDAKHYYTMEKEIRWYGIKDPRDWNRKDFPRLSLEEAEQITGDLVHES